MDLNVILAAGGSGGHIFPAVALAEELENIGVKNIIFVSSKRRLDKNILKGCGHICHFMSINPMPFGMNPFRWLVFVLKFIKDTISSFFLLYKIRPDVVVGFGGYSSGPVVRCSGMLAIPVLIHEQNLVPGRANRLLSRYAKKVAVSFRGTEAYFRDVSGGVVFSGNPLRRSSLKKDRPGAAQRLGLSEDKKTVLVMGGSQGSRFLNSVASKAAGMIGEKYGDEVQFIHLTGKADFDDISSFYSDHNIAGKVISFLNGIEDAYSLCDMAISRAGAAAIFELAFFSRPMVLVPYPNPKNNQRSNAEYFSKNGAAVLREESGLSAGSLAEEVIDILWGGDKYDSMSKAAASLSVPEAAKKLAEEVVSLAEQK